LPRVLSGLAWRHRQLKHISVSFLSGAMECLDFPVDGFPSLQSLALTAREHLQPADVRKLRMVLRAAAEAVAKLPALQIMELWTCERGHAAIFRYEASEAMQSGTCEITWRSSWHTRRSTLGTKVIKAWEDTAYRASLRPTVILDPLPDDGYDKYGAILRHLKLRDFILHPISTMQAQVGTGAEGKPEVPVWKPSSTWDSP
jgi:hypothetical protein